MALMNTITDKPDWQHKVFDEAIVKKWRSEALSPNPLKNKFEAQAEADVQVEGTASETSSVTGSDWSAPKGEVQISPKMVDWAIAEVKYKAGLFNDINCVEALDGVWKSDNIVGEDLRAALNNAVKPLEDVPEEDKDWHPGSDHQVLDLVHPSIYPLVYGQSLILANDVCGVSDYIRWIGKGQILPIPDESTAGLGPEWSKRFQWLPAEFDALPGTLDVTAKSYVNNLHPTYHEELYSIISRVVAKAVPLWDRVLSHVICPNIPPRVSDWSDSYEGYVDDDEEPDQGEDEDYDDHDARTEAWRNAREIIEPEPGEFRPAAERIKDLKPDNSLRQVDLRKDYGRLQIIVKLANIHLTPDKPEYPGGSWHVEGQANESICASAIYYYSSDNVTDSYLSFRQQVDCGVDLPYPQNEHKAVQQIFGFDNYGPTIQNLGDVLTRQSRLLCFPNVMQHRVSPFRVADPSKPGVRKILALFLVDPHLRIISTANVPPQQHSWWSELVHEARVHEKMPPELVDKVLNDSGFPFSLDKAKEQREELMAERKDFVKNHNREFVNWKHFNSRPFGNFGDNFQQAILIAQYSTKVSNFGQLVPATSGCRFGTVVK
ncbi:MAG: hypothetical protein Q9169_007449 [Polycauliona sp. 2 TL-2023]